MDLMNGNNIPVVYDCFYSTKAESNEKLQEKFPDKVTERIKLFVDYFGEDRRQINEDLCPMARNIGNWEYKENEIAYRDVYEFLTTSPPKDLVQMIGVIAGSGMGKSFFLDIIARILNSRIFTKLEKDEKHNPNTQFVCVNISFNGETDVPADVLDRLNKNNLKLERTDLPFQDEQNLREKNKEILEREAGLRIVFNYFQKSPGYKGINGKWEKFYGDMKDVRLGIDDALKIVIEDALKHKNVDEKKNTIVVIGVDEFKKFTNNHEQLRSLICKSSDRFYKKYIAQDGKEKDNLQVRMIFTSFLPTDAPETTPTERPILWVALESLSKQIVTEDLMKEFYNCRPAFRAVINCCIRHQRALEQFYSILTDLRKDEMHKDWFDNSITAPISAIGKIGDNERDIFFKLMEKLSKSMRDSTAKVSWELFEPCFTGRMITPIFTKVNSITKKEEIFFENPTAFNYKYNKKVEKNTPFVNLFSSGIYSPALSRESYNKEIVAQSNLFWLYSWYYYKM
eukprot:TRINITY_DN1012_c0_g3_i1.p1 TRINITY_DN1012_c0_g3~~TRINITY_DN1012_c0_g3_i1.p1  ORF type:complete len:548 (+),score=123.95 TRINITY_DN1012_c0_g3_i1:113-1645(+)